MTARVEAGKKQRRAGELDAAAPKGAWPSLGELSWAARNLQRGREVAQLRFFNNGFRTERSTAKETGAREAPEV
jgi:hypothetical protein